MSNNMDNSNIQENEKRVDQNKRFNDDKPAHQEYSESNHHFVPQMTHGLIPVSRQEDNLYMQNVNVSKPPIPEDAEVCDAMNFLNRIKNEFSEDLVTYDNFLETMRDYKFGKIDADEVCKAVVLLFKDKSHLIDLFNEYLPNHLKFPPDNRKNEFMARNFERMSLNQQHPQFRRNFINQKIMHPGLRPMMPKMGPPPHLQHQPSHLSGLLPGMVPGFAPTNIPHPNSQSQIRIPPPNVQKINPNSYNLNAPPKTEDETIKKNKQMILYSESKNDIIINQMYIKHLWKFYKNLIMKVIYLLYGPKLEVYCLKIKI
ncbi:histone deacetylase sin3 component [Vairimorpha apis BRL 01]|uniref:Histone deacetylase sin3 component n=1 Tax=Vairimorpha apis BRL 01 TaxID=1037528 RepID=T0L1K7_9MICR|nr:histone deacetylase sin3 component [Vairimorpha apis BRL 01]